MKNFRLEIILFFLILVIYLLTLCPTIYTGDSPLICTSAFSLGLAHPPGYPLYILSGKAMTMLPFGNVAYKLNLMSAFWGCLASILVFRSVFILTEDKISAISASLLSALIGGIWIESIKAEVYSLNSFLAMLILYLVIKAIKEAPREDVINHAPAFAMTPFYLIMFVLGIGMGNHHTIGFMIFPALVGMFFLRENLLSSLASPKNLKIFWGAVTQIALLFFFFIAGFSVYAFSYIRSLKAASDGILFSYANAETFTHFVDTFFRKEYSSSTLDAIKSIASASNAWLYGPYNVVKYLIIPDFGYLLLFILPGILIFLTPYASRLMLLCFLFTFLAWIPLFGYLTIGAQNPPADDFFFIKPYFMPLNYFICIIVGYGAFYISVSIRRLFTPAYKATRLAILLIPLAVLPENIKDVNLDRYFIASDFSKDILTNIPPKSILLVNSDISYFTLIYNLLIERLKEDTIIVFAHKNGIRSDINSLWKYRNMFPEFFEERPISRGRIDKMYSEKGRLFAYSLLGQPEFIKERYRTEPFILSYRLFPKDGDGESSWNKYLSAFDKFVYERSSKIKTADIFSRELQMNYFITINHYAYLLRQKGDFGRSEHYYKLSNSFINPEGIIYYMAYLEFTGNKNEAYTYLDSLEKEVGKDDVAKKIVYELKRSIK